MQLLLPALAVVPLQPREIQARREPPRQRLPVVLPRLDARVNVRVDEVLKRVDTRHEREERHDLLKVPLRGPVRVVAEKHRRKGQREALHAHRGDLGELQRGRAVGQQRLVPARPGVEGVAALVQQRAHVRLGPDRVHEDERQAAFRKRGLVTARGLALATAEIEHFALPQRVEYLAQFRRDLVENPAATARQLLIRLKRSERRPALRIDGQVPRPQRFHAQLRLALLREPRGRRHDDFLNRVVEREAVVRRIVEPLHGLEHVLAIIPAAGVAGDLVPQRDHLFIQLIQLAGILQVAVGNEPPGLLAQRPVRLFLVAGHLLERLLPAVVLARHRPGKRLVLGRQLLVLDQQRDVLFAEDLDAVTHAPQQDLVPLGRQVQLARRFDELPPQLVVPRLGVGLDVLDEVQISLLPLRVVRLAGHRGIALRALLVETGLQLAPVDQPLLELPGGFDAPLRQLLVIRLGVGPVAEVRVGGDVLAGKLGGGLSSGHHGTPVWGLWHTHAGRPIITVWRAVTRKGPARRSPPATLESAPPGLPS